jgi:hypothetical protein
MVNTGTEPSLDDKLNIINRKLTALLELLGNPYYDDDGKLKTKCGSFDIFHGKGVVKLTVLPATRNQAGFVVKEGCVLVEAAPTTGNKTQDGLPEYDWQQSKKITFAINSMDISRLIDPTVDSDVRLTHQDQAKPPTFDKSFAIKPPSGGYNTYNIYVEDKIKGAKVFVPMTPGQYVQFQRLLLNALPIIIGSLR